MVHSEASFSAPPQVHTFHGLLFDMDGTIMDSTEAIIKHWHKIANEIGVDPEVVLQTSHGRRSIDVLEILEPKLANWEYVKHMEGLVPKEFGENAVEIAGARALLDQLNQNGVPWCIVTSGTTPLVTGWLDRLELAHPENLVVAEHVERGKPDPECYRLGCSKLKLQENPSMLVLEDAPAGVRAGKAAGFKVVALATTHSLEQLKEAGADWIVHDMRSVSLKSWNKTTGEAEIEITNALV